jgi:c-di-GMP-binding flagellar brake protein YcgR
MPERRGADRFPIEQEVRYRVISRRQDDDSGAGRTVNMSSSGILFSTEKDLQPGRQVELSVAWPAQLNNSTPLKLVARGRVVRVEEQRAALEIQHYEFRTQGRGA